MKKSRLIIAAIALMGIAACGKIETPNVQEEPEVIAPEQTVAAEPEQNMDVKSVARTLDGLCKICEVKEFIQSLIVKVNQSETPWHLDIYVARPKTEEQEEFPFISGSVGFSKGIFHPIVLDVDILLVDFISVTGTVDVRQTASNYAHALKHIDSFMGDITAQYYLDKATEGLDLTFMGGLRLFFKVDVDEEGYRSINLYIYNPDDPSFEPMPIPSFSELFAPKS